MSQSLSFISLSRVRERCHDPKSFEEEEEGQGGHKEEGEEEEGEEEEEVEEEEGDKEDNLEILGGVPRRMRATQGTYTNHNSLI